MSFDGAIWTPMTSGTLEDLLDVWGNAADDVFVVGTTGTILNYGGAEWGPMASGTFNHIRASWGFAADNVFAVGESGTILRFMR